MDGNQNRWGVNHFLCTRNYELDEIGLFTLSFQGQALNVRIIYDTHTYLTVTLYVHFQKPSVEAKTRKIFHVHVSLDIILISVDSSYSNSDRNRVGDG